jgi:Effector-associated domain 11
MRHLKFIYNLILKQNIALEKKIFLRIHPGFNAGLHHKVTLEKNLGWLEKYEIDKTKETITFYYTGLGYDEFYTEMIQVLTFEKSLEGIVLNERKSLVESIENYLWVSSKTDFISYLDKVKNEIRFINIHLEQYEEAKNLVFIEKTLNEITEYIDTKFGNNYQYLQNKSVITIRQEKKIWLKLVAEDKIKELVDELIEFGIEKGEDDLLLISNRWYALQKDVQNGIIKRDDYDLENNKITKSLISFVRELKITE